MPGSYSVSLRRDLLLTLAGRGMSVVAGLAYVAVVSRWFTAEEVSVLAVATSISALVDAVKGLGLAAILLQTLPVEAKAAECGPLVRTYLLCSAAPWLFAAAAAVACPDSALQLGIWQGAMLGLANSGILVFQAAGGFSTSAAVHVFLAVAARLIPVLGVACLGWTLDTFLAVSAAAAGVAAAVLVWLLRDQLLAPGRLLLPWCELWVRARPFYGSGMLRYAAGQADQLLVAAIFPAPALAAYHLQRRLYSVVVVAVDAAVDSLTPRLSQAAARSREEAWAILNRWSRDAWAFGAVGAALTAAAGYAGSGWLLGTAYNGSRHLPPLLAIAALCYAVYSLRLVAETVAGESGSVLRAMACAAAVNLGLTPLLATAWGIYALPCAMAAGYVAGLLATNAKRPVVEEPA